MNLDEKRLLICEEALIRYTGHFHSWVKAIKHINEQAGVKVEIAANKHVHTEREKEKKNQGELV